MKHKDESPPLPMPTYADAARAYFKHHRVFRYRMKKISDMTDDEVIQKCHWWQEEHHMVDDYWAFAEEYFSGSSAIAKGSEASEGN